MGPIARRSRFPKALRGKAAMISVIGACEQWGAKIAVDTIREVCPACVPETGLGLLGDEDEDSISHARCRTAKSAGTRCAAIRASRRSSHHSRRSKRQLLSM